MLKFIATLLFAQVLLAAPLPFCHEGFTGRTCIYDWEQAQHKRVEEERTAQQQAEERKHNNGVAGRDTVSLPFRFAYGCRTCHYNRRGA